MNDKDIYRSMQALTDDTKRVALEHNFNMVEKCLGIVERRMVQSYMPAGLYALYIQQVLRSKHWPALKSIRHLEALGR